jgi:hypothetical protein
VPGVVFILSVYYHQLEQCVEATYGRGVDQHVYLRRLIDWSYALPPGSNAAFAQHLYKKFAFEELVTIDKNNLCNVFAYLATLWGLRFRVQEQCFTELNLVYRAHAGNRRQPGTEAAVMSALKAYDLEKYTVFLAGKMAYKDFLDL